MERKEAIHYLRLMLSGMKYQYGIEQIEEDKEIEKLNIDAVEFAIASLKTDEAYQLEYENRDAVEVVRCKDCKHFELDKFENVNGIRLLVAHEICNFWGNGCKTYVNGYCFSGVKKE